MAAPVASQVASFRLKDVVYRGIAEAEDSLRTVRHAVDEVLLDVDAMAGRESGFDASTETARRKLGDNARDVVIGEILRGLYIAENYLLQASKDALRCSCLCAPHGKEGA